MMRVVGESLDTIAREHNNSGALQLFGDWQKILQIGNKLIASPGVGDARPHSGGSIESNPKRTFLGVRAPKICIRPVFEFLNQLNCLITSFCYFFQALLEWKILVDSPEHYGDVERDRIGVGGLRRKEGCGDSCRSQSGDGSLRKSATIH